MQVNVESTAGLERRIHVEIPEERVQGEVDKRLQNLARTANLPGFRRGKAPMKMIAKRYGPQVRDEVVGEIVRSSFHEALSSEQLRPAGTPTIDPLEANPGQGVSYTAIFDIYPEVSLPDFTALRVVRPMAEVTEDDVDRMVERLQTQRRTWEPTERAAMLGDRLTIDFDGTVEGESRDDLRSSDWELELGANTMMSGFEDGLVGTTPGESRTLDLAFAAKTENELAGRDVRFEVTVKQVAEPITAEVDEAFVRSFGVEDGTVEGLRTEIRSNMERERDEAVSTQTKQKVMEALLDGRSMELPRALVDDELDRAMDQYRTELKHSGVEVDEVELHRDRFEEKARQRVSLGLLLAELIRENELKADPAKVSAHVERIASTYERPAEVVSWYYSNQQLLANVQSVVLESEAVDWVLERCTVEDAMVPFEELMNPGQAPGQGQA